MGKVLNVGSFNVDVTCYTEKLPRHGETVFGSSIVMCAGGKGFNQSTGAAHSGAQVVMVAKIGGDSLSAIAKNYFDKEKNISQKYLGVEEDASTGSAFIEVDEVTGENRIVVIKGSNSRVGKEDVLKAEEDIAAADVLLAQFETSLEAVGELIRLAKKHNKPVIVNPAPSIPVPEGFFKGVTLFTPNETEAEFYTGVRVESPEDAEKAAKELFKLGVKGVVITLGKNGAYYNYDGESGIVPPVKVKAVDTTGAGDAFNGALAAALAEGKNIKDAIRFANCFAAISVTRKGTCDSMPTREETEALLKTL